MLYKYLYIYIMSDFTAIFLHTLSFNMIHKQTYYKHQNWLSLISQCRDKVCHILLVSKWFLWQCSCLSVHRRWDIVALLWKIKVYFQQHKMNAIENYEKHYERIKNVPVWAFIGMKGNVCHKPWYSIFINMFKRCTFLST